MATDLILITGDVNTGKTTFLKEMSENLLSLPGIKIKGFLAEGIYEDHQKSGYNLKDITTSRKELICTRLPVKNWEKTGKFYFNPDVFRVGEEILKTPINADVIILDEFGPLELSGKGWWNLIDSILSQTEGCLIMSIRTSILKESILKFTGYSIHVFNINNSNQHTLSQVLKLIE